MDPFLSNNLEIFNEFHNNLIVYDIIESLEPFDWTIFPVQDREISGLIKLDSGLYQGEILDSLPDGRGVHIDKEGIRYDGFFKQGVK